MNADTNARPLSYLELSDPAPVLAAAERVSEAAGELLSFATPNPYINIGFECDVSAGEIVAIKVYTLFDRDNMGIEFFVGDLDLIRTVVRLRDCSLWLPSSLTYKELRNRIRKAAKTDEVFI